MNRKDGNTPTFNYKFFKRGKTTIEKKIILPSATTTSSDTPSHIFIHEFWESSIFFCLSSHILSGLDQELGSLFCELPVERSFSQQRMRLPVPHDPPCVQKNLHNSSEKCQHTGSMVIRHFQHYPCVPVCVLQNNFSEMSKRAELLMTHAVFLTLIISRWTHRNVQ